MPLPTAAKIQPQPLDPRDKEIFTAIISKAGISTAAFPLLDADETVAEYDLELTAEAVAIGLEIVNAPGFYTTLSGTLLTYWVMVDPAMRSLAVFNKGVTVGLELTIRTDKGREKQKTIGIKVGQQ